MKYGEIRRSLFVRVRFSFQKWHKNWVELSWKTTRRIYLSFAFPIVLTLPLHIIIIQYNIEYERYLGTFSAHNNWQLTRSICMSFRKWLRKKSMNTVIELEFVNFMLSSKIASFLIISRLVTSIRIYCTKLLYLRSLSQRTFYSAANVFDWQRSKCLLSVLFALVKGGKLLLVLLHAKVAEEPDATK